MQIINALYTSMKPPWVALSPQHSRLSLIDRRKGGCAVYPRAFTGPHEDLYTNFLDFYVNMF